MHAEAAAGPPAVPAAEEVREEVVRVDPGAAEGVAEIGAPEDVLLAVALLEARGAELVVLRALLLVGEDRVGLADLLELLLGLLVVRVLSGWYFRASLR